MSPDGSNMSLLEKFHRANRLEKVPTTLVTMTPRKGIRWPLTEVLKAVDNYSNETPDTLEDLDPETRAAVVADLNKFNVHANNISSELTANKAEEAVSLVRQAELLEADAQAMRVKAYQIDPSLAPSLPKRNSVASKTTTTTTTKPTQTNKKEQTKKTPIVKD